MKFTARKAIIGLLLLVFLGSTGMVVYQSIQYRQGEQTYSEAAELAGLPDLTDLPELEQQLPPEQSSDLPPAASSPPYSGGEEPPTQEAPVYTDPYADALAAMDFTALREANSDVLGWILVPDSRISYPLVQGVDNDYYLNHTWRKSRNSVGAIFMEHQNNNDFSDFNTIIYGHRMNNSSMFGTLHNYKDASYWAEHPVVYITDDSGSHRYEIFAAYEVPTTERTYQISFSSDQSKQRFLDFCIEQSVIDTGITPNVSDRILTLSSCTGNGHETRWVVQAVRYHGR